MSSNEQLLKQKTILLVSKDRELSALRKKHERLTSWLSLARQLPEFVGSGAELWQTCRRFSENVVATLEIHAVLFLEQIRPTTLRRVDAGEAPSTDVELTDGVAETFEATNGGMCNDADRHELRTFGESLGVHRFLWCRLDVPGRRSLLLVVGFDRERAQYFPPFETDDFLHFTNAARQLELLLGNSCLLEQLAEEKRALERLNAELERRVEDRTRELGDALRALREADQRMRDDIEEARLFQEKMLPALPVAADIEFAAAYRPLERVGGDIFDVQRVGAGRYRVFLADATGHGVQASMRTIVLRAEYERLSRAHESPHALLAELNRRLVAAFPGREIMCTACCLDVAVNGSGATARYSNAAHPSLLRWSEGEVVEIYGDGPFLGLENRTTWPEPLVFTLSAGDVLLAYSDGLSEQRDAEGKTFDGSMRDARLHGASAAAAAEGVLRDFDAFRGDVPAEDDVTLVALSLPGS